MTSRHHQQDPQKKGQSFSISCYQRITGQDHVTAVCKYCLFSINMQIRPIPVLGIVLPLLSAVQANVEKTIFLAPAPATIPSQEPSLDDLGVERLSPQNPVVRTRLNASFPTTAATEGTESWFFLENLNPGQRYEVRVCWLSTVSLSTLLLKHPYYISKLGQLTMTNSNQHPLLSPHTPYPKQLKTHLSCLRSAFTHPPCSRHQRARENVEQERIQNQIHRYRRNIPHQCLISAEVIRGSMNA